MRNYIYLGDKMTDTLLKGMQCTACLRADVTCIREKNGNMLVKHKGNRYVFVARLLRKIK